MRANYSERKVEHFLRNHEQPGPAYGLMKQQIASTTFKILLNGVLQSFPQVFLNMSLIGMSVQLVEGFPWQKVVVMIVGYLNMFKSCYEAFSVERWVTRTLEQEPDVFQGHPHFRNDLELRKKGLRVAGFFYIVC